MRDVYIIGVGMTPFGKYMDKNWINFFIEYFTTSMFEN